MQHSLIFISLSILLSFHDFHVTHTTIHYDEYKEILEITINVAVDDLERALEDQGVLKTRICTDYESELADKFIEDYFRKRFIIRSNKDLFEYNWVGKELSKDLHNLYVYFEIVDCNQNGEITSLSIENTIFIDILRDQVNMVVVEYKEFYHNLTFSLSKKNQLISFITE